MSQIKSRKPNFALVTMSVTGTSLSLTTPLVQNKRRVGFAGGFKIPSETVAQSQRKQNFPKQSCRAETNEVAKAASLTDTFVTIDEVMQLLHLCGNAAASDAPASSLKQK